MINTPIISLLGSAVPMAQEQLGYTPTQMMAGSAVPAAQQQLGYTRQPPMMNVPVPQIQTPPGLGSLLAPAPQQKPSVLSGLLSGPGSSARYGALAKALTQNSATPMSLGQRLTSGLIEGSKAAREEGSRGLFEGSGQSAQSFNMIRKLAPIIQSGRASEQQISDYKLLEQIVSKDVTQTRVNPESGATETYLVPGIDLAQIGLPSFKGGTAGGTTEGGERMIGSKEATYTETQTKNGRFASAMYDAEKNLRLLELTEGYDPTSDADYWAQKAPGGLTGYLQSRQGQLYSQAKEQFINANLRSDSGANIAESEFRRKEAELFPVPGDTIATVEAKRKARLQQLKAMAESSGGFYTRKFGKDKPLDAFEKNTPRGSRKNPVVVASEEEGDGLPAGSIYVIGDNKILYQSEGR
jgi:hypothetical protein